MWWWWFGGASSGAAVGRISLETNTLMHRARGIYVSNTQDFSLSGARQSNMVTGRSSTSLLPSHSLKVAEQIPKSEAEMSLQSAQEGGAAAESSLQRDSVLCLIHNTLLIRSFSLYGGRHGSQKCQNTTTEAETRQKYRNKTTNTTTKAEARQ